LLRKAYDELADVSQRLNDATDAKAALARDLEEARALRQADQHALSSATRRAAELDDEVRMPTHMCP
jgi:hypothetical protein